METKFEKYRPWFVRNERLRWGWRIAFYIAASIAGLIVFSQIFGYIVSQLWMSRGISREGVQLLFTDFSTRPFNYPDVAIAYIIGRTLVVLGIIWLFRQRIDHKPFLELGFQMPRGWWRELIGGFAFSVAGWVVIFLLALTFGAVVITDYAWVRSSALGAIGGLGLGLFFNLLVGVAEESDARGYIMQNLAGGIGLLRAVFVSSLYFGLLHLFNPGAGWLSTVGIFCAGILLALGYVLTGRLWFSIGMHAAWNFAEGPLFGFRVSGLDLGGLVGLEITSPPWLTGGAFGPEAGTLAIGVEIAMIALLIAWKQGRFNGFKEFLSVFFAGWGWSQRHYPR